MHLTQESKVEGIIGEQRVGEDPPAILRWPKAKVLTKQRVFPHLPVAGIERLGFREAGGAVGKAFNDLVKAGDVLWSGVAEESVHHAAPPMLASFSAGSV